MSADFSGEFVNVLNGEDALDTAKACRKMSPGFQVKAFLINLRGRVAPACSKSCHKNIIISIIHIIGSAVPFLLHMKGGLER